MPVSLPLVVKCWSEHCLNGLDQDGNLAIWITCQRDEHVSYEIAFGDARRRDAKREYISQTVGASAPSTVGTPDWRNEAAMDMNACAGASEGPQM
jgi:hypothetical protein